MSVIIITTMTVLILALLVCLRKTALQCDIYKRIDKHNEEEIKALRQQLIIMKDLLKLRQQ